MKSKEELIKVFDSYVKKYDLNDKLISVKYSHTFRVADNSEKIAKSLGLNQEQIYIAYIIGLLHDIGRFYQATTYKTFKDLGTIDHANLGVEILKNNDYIHEYVENDKYEDIILNSIYFHNKFELPKDDKYSDIENTFFKIIRDADKIDIYNILSNTDYAVNENKFDISDVSEKVLKSLKNHSLINRKDEKTQSDSMITIIAMVYDIYYPCSYRFLLNSGYVSKYVNKILKPLNDISKNSLIKIDKDILEYIKNKVN